MLIRVPYGKSYADAELSEEVSIEEIQLPESESLKPKDNLVVNSLLKLPLTKIAQARSLAVVVSDISRPVPNSLLLEQLWSNLARLGMDKRRITIFIATGLHRPPNAEEIRLIVGNYCADNFKIVTHNAESASLIKLGNTSRGTVVKINGEFLQSEIKMAIGLVQPHQIAGFSGGAKNVAIGLAGKDTITTNHSLLDNTACYPGNIKDNPARQEIEEIGRMAGLNFAVNLILDQKKQPIFISAGPVAESYGEAVNFAARYYRIPVKDKKDLVIVSPGGYPKDLNLYQAQKALNAAMDILKPNGAVILVASCNEGLGNNEFLNYLGKFSTPAQVTSSFKEGPFSIGPHKAYLWSKKIMQHRTILVSNIQPAEARKLMVECVKTLREALAKVPEKLRAGCKIGLIPQASCVIPILKDK